MVYIISENGKQIEELSFIGDEEFFVQCGDELVPLIEIHKHNGKREFIDSLSRNPYFVEWDFVNNQPDTNVWRLK